MTVRHSLLFPAFALLLWAGCKSEPEKPPRPETTVENLKVAHAAAYHRAVFYSEASAQANAERLQNLGALYAAIARSESIHAAGHEALLQLQSETTDTSRSTALPLGSVRQSLKMGVSLEATETQGLYPPMARAAIAENWPEAAEQFSTFQRADARHAELLTEAQNRKGVLSVRAYVVCGQCGYIGVDQAEGSECPVCTKSMWERI